MANPSSWVVKGKVRGKSNSTKPFAERIAEALSEAGIDPAGWTDEELVDWRNAEESWEIRQAMRMEFNRRANACKGLQEQIQQAPEWVWH